MAKHPAEVFGYPVDVHSNRSIDARKRYCVLLQTKNATRKVVSFATQWVYALFHMAIRL